MTKIKTEDYNSLIREIHKLQTICKNWREENRELKRQLAKFKNLEKGMPEFLKGFAKNNRR